MVAAEVDTVEKERVRKRPRLAWDVKPSEPEVQRALAIVGNEGPTTRHASPPRRDDDREGHYVFNLGENLTPRYKILSKMGEGTFGRVLECWDRQTREYVAIKVVRSIRKYRDAAMIEVDILQKIAKNDQISTSRCVQIRNWFDYRNHICIVFEKLGPSLFDFLKRNKYCPFPVDLVREFGRQLLESVAYMHDLRLIHTDLKPENILLVSSEFIKVPGCKRNSSDETHFRFLPKSSAIKLIDFGSTAYDNQNHSSIVSTRHYRAPEVILGLGWSYPCDLWSVGCILVELCSGEALFQTHENLEHLAMMERVLGPLPDHMIRNANRGAEIYFRGASRLNWPEGAVSRESIRAVKKLDRLKDMISQQVERSRTLLIELLHGLLKYEPSERLTAQQALNHPFFKNLT
ncbi:serine/threonine-protein kinase AFC3 isoform X2 [Ricinus communis]|uniref:dual-specificity kinase n=1 Tax=Ricinus communis TaxID=3988 RepID=B9RS69_RICCO|nr:serine/threonine-protein kinase AFC3 isoform X2 [Ricinus communis]EEF45929.1 afc, putative [Ricinus communis]|eukprot:XP_002516588.1 serine/threonine-protein kinase AFC3 isoform X2 [Ricinus communis]